MPLLLLLLALPVLAQNSPPQWVEESWRAARYPSAEWYTGFARDNVKGQPNSETYQSIEKEAQKRLIESINVRISGTSTSQTKMASKNNSETINQSYAQITQVSANAEIAKAQTLSYHDAKNNIIYAFAAGRKSDLADYYATRIEFYLNEAQRGIELSKQLLELDKSSQAWMAENLNYEVGVSMCYDNDENNCQIYGRLYDWNTAMKACPNGWHLPSEAEWSELSRVVSSGHDFYNVAGEKLRAKNGWDNDANGADDYGFTALPDGQYVESKFSSVGSFGYWWSSTGGSKTSYTANMDIDSKELRPDNDDKSNLASVRCVKD